MTDSTKTINSVHVFSEQQQAVTGSDIIQQLNDNDGTVFVFYSHPSVYVAEQLKQQNNGDDACSEWLVRINDALSAQRQNRRRIRLLCLQDALEHPQALTEQTGLDVSVLAGFDVKPDGLELMAGHQLVLQNDDIMALIERLEASTLQLSERAYHVAVNVEQILSDVVETKRELAEKGQESRKAEEQKLTTLKEEIQLLEKQLRQVQEDLEDYYIKYQESQREVMILKSDNESYRTKFKKVSDKNSQLLHGLANAQRQLLDSRIKASGNKPLAKSARIKQKLLRNKKASDLPGWLCEQIQQIEHSPFFDKEWYLKQYPDVEQTNIEPAEHFLRYGGFENRRPSERFDTEFYVKKYPDVLAEGMNPLLHYILHGAAEGRLPKAGNK